jgi:hypothetical protein
MNDASLVSSSRWCKGSKTRVFAQKSVRREEGAGAQRKPEEENKCRIWILSPGLLALWRPTVLGRWQHDQRKGGAQQHRASGIESCLFGGWGGQWRGVHLIRETFLRLPETFHRPRSHLPV